MKKSYMGQRPNKPVVEETGVQDKIKSVGLVQSLLDAHVVYNGQNSGERYEWSGAGAIVEVNAEDIPELLAKRRGKKPCCGSQESPIFQLLQ